MVFTLDGIASPIPGIPYEMALVLGIAAGVIAAVTGIVVLFLVIGKRKKKENNNKKGE